jgi:hypothetical protein
VEAFNAVRIVDEYFPTRLIQMSLEAWLEGERKLEFGGPQRRFSKYQYLLDSCAKASRNEVDAVVNLSVSDSCFAGLNQRRVACACKSERYGAVLGRHLDESLRRGICREFRDHRPACAPVRVRTHRLEL